MEEVSRRREERGRAFLLADNSDEEVDHVNGGQDDDENDGRVEDHVDPAVEVEQTCLEVYQCEICEKQFKSESHLAQHNASKPHRKKVQELEKKSKIKSKTLSPTIETVATSETLISETTSDL